MNIETLEEELNLFKSDFESKIEKLENLLYEIKYNKRGKWKPEEGEMYYNIVCDGSIYEYSNTSSIYDNGAISIGNTFKTREEAKFVLEKLKVIEELRQFEEPKDREWNNNNYHFYIYYDTIVKTVTISYCSRDKSNDIYFESKEIAEQAIKSVGEDRIKKYYFEV